MRLIELFNALSSDEPLKRAVIETDYLEIQLSVADEVQETAFKEFISKLPLINFSKRLGYYFLLHNTRLWLSAQKITIILVTNWRHVNKSQHSLRK